MAAKYPKEFNEEYKSAIRKRDGGKCAVCKMPGKEIHHINYIKRDTHPLNTITLCKSCHGITNANRDYWRYALTRLVIIRPEIDVYYPEMTDELQIRCKHKPHTIRMSNEMRDKLYRRAGYCPATLNDIILKALSNYLTRRSSV